MTPSWEKYCDFSMLHMEKLRLEQTGRQFTQVVGAEVGYELGSSDSEACSFLFYYVASKICI
jgi:hypothetical protein